MSEAIVKLTSDRIKVKGGEYVRDYQHGKWIDKGWKGDWEFETCGRGNCWHEYECSECGFHKKGGKSNFCPNCGADMREREGE